jgi:hypothetical protein
MRFRTRLIWAVVALALSIVVTPSAVDLAHASMGAGHGSYFWYAFLFPYVVIVARLTDHDFSGFIDSLLYVQLSVETVLASLALLLFRRAWFWTILALVVLHLVAYWSLRMDVWSS